MHVRSRSSSHLRGLAKPLLSILLFLLLLPPHELIKYHGLQNRYLPARAMLKPEPPLNHQGVLLSMSPRPRSGHTWRLPPDQYRHGSLTLSWMVCLSLPMQAFGCGRRGSHCPKLSSRSPSARRCECFYRRDRGVHREEASMAYYSSNLSFLVFFIFIYSHYCHIYFFIVVHVIVV